MGLAGVSYYFAAQLSLSLALPNSPGITPIWLPAPIAWFVCYLGGFYLMPGIWLGNLCMNLPLLLKNTPLEWAIVLSGIKAMIACGTAIFGTLLLRRFLIGRIFDRTYNVMVFAVIGLMISALTPTLSLTLFGLAGVIPWSLYGEIWITWWTGDAVSVLIWMPMLVCWRRFSWRSIRCDRVLDGVLLLVGLALISWITASSDYPIEYLMIPGLLWAALRLGNCGATLGIVLVTGMAVLTTANGRGPFLRSSLNDSLILLQTFMGTVTVTTLLMLGVLAEKQKIQSNLIWANEQLEDRVRDRTETLERTLKDLQITQSQLIQTEKMRSLGQLVAGLAHEINNPVSFIYGNISHAQTYLNHLFEILSAYQHHHPQTNIALETLLEERELNYIREDFPKVLTSMQTGAERIRQLILTLRNFSRLDEGGLKSVDLHDGIDSTLLVLQHRLNKMSLGFPIAVVKQYGNLPRVECYADEINQVLMHLLNNAIDALEAHSSLQPTLRIETLSVPESGQVELSIWNDGQTIPDPVRSRMFDPFFTTKPIGQGTGLGLSISLRIIEEKHGGTLKFRSEDGYGTQFLIRIPIRQSQT